ncbi:MAG: HAD-IA family hydrolase [Candidatus Bathyarchaeia archaeon]
MPTNLRISKTSNIETVSLDCGGTLYYEAVQEFVVYKEILNELGYDVNDSVVKEALESARACWLEEKARTDKIWNDDMRISLLKKMVATLGLSNPNTLAMKLSNLWFQKAAFQAYEDAEPTLKMLKQRGIRVIAVSNVSSEKNLRIYLDKAGLGNYFDVLVASGTVGYEKPNPEIFKIASKLSNTPLTRMMHVGDKYEEDYLGAKSVGMKALLLDRKGLHKNENCMRISRLDELFAYL